MVKCKGEENIMERLIRISEGFLENKTISENCFKSLKEWINGPSQCLEVGDKIIIEIIPDIIVKAVCHQYRKKTDEIKSFIAPDGTLYLKD